MALVSLCEEYINGQSSSDVVKTIASSIIKGGADILELVRSLEVYLASINVDSRCAATKLLSCVLERLDSNQLLVDEDVHYLVEFYCDRLKDRAIVLPYVLAGLHVLVAAGHGIATNDAVSISRRLFKEVHCQALQFEERHKLFDIFLFLLTHHLDGLVECSEEFVMGYIQMFDGERDPRNLLLIFSSVAIIAQNLRFDAMTEDLFDVISCYFPIDFTPPPNDSTAVTREALVRGLRLCLSSSPKFAEMCLPLLLEKLSSDVLAAKLDSLETLVSAIPIFGPLAVAPFLQSLWTTIKKEMFNSSNKDLQLGCVAAVKSIGFSLSQPLHDAELEAFITLILQDCQRHLIEPELKLMEPAVQLLCGVTVASDPAATSILSAVMPLLIKQYFVSTHASRKKVLLSALEVFVKAATACPTTTDAPSPLLVCKGPLLDAVRSALNQPEPTCQKLACAIFSDLLTIRDMLDSSEVIEYCQQLKLAALADANVDIRDVFGSALSSVCKVFPQLAKDQLVVPLFVDLKLHPKNSWLLVFLSPTSALTAVVLPSLLEILQHFSTELSDHVNRAESLAWQGIMPIASTLLEVVKQNAEAAPLTVSALDSLIEVSVKLTNSHWECCISDVRTLVDRISAVLSWNARHASCSWCEHCMNVIVEATVGAPPLEPPSSFRLPLLTAAVGAIPPTALSKWTSELCSYLLKQAILSVHLDTATYAVKGYASVLNKASDDDILSELVESHMQDLSNALSPEEETSKDARCRALAVWIWLAKALLMRGHRQGILAVHKVLELCVVPCKEIGAGAADGFQLLLSDCTDLNSECHANIRLFYKQQLFVSVLPDLIQMVSNVEESRKQHLLQALSYLMTGVPRQVICGELPKVLPLLLESLASKDDDVKLSTLNAVLSLLKDAVQSFSGYVNTLLSRLLSLATDQRSMAVRRTALECVHAMCSLPVHLLYPHQRHVLHSLAHCLDDHKRLVRKAAVEASAQWYLL